MNLTAEQLLLADAILRHRPFSRSTAIHQALHLAGEYMPEDEQAQLQAYLDSIAIDMVPDGFRYVSRNAVSLLSLVPLDLQVVIDGPSPEDRLGAGTAEGIRLAGCNRLTTACSASWQPL